VTASRTALPELPKVELEIARESRIGEGGFLVLRRAEITVVRQGERSQPVAYDFLDRRALDACVMVAHHEEHGRVYVWMRSSVRPPVALRPALPKHSGVLWEVPAGLIEPGEAPAAAAAREVGEELGFAVDAGELLQLGHGAFPAPGFVGEIHHYFSVAVDPGKRAEPEGDGSPIEEAAVVVAVPLEEALAACRRGEVPDSKTEIALRRFADVVAQARAGHA